MPKGILGCLLFCVLTPLAARAAVPAVEGRDLLTHKTVKVEPAAGAVVVFLSDHCPCSDSHIQEVKALAREYKMFSFVGVHANSDEPEAGAREYFQRADLGFPVLQDENGRLVNRFKALKTPHAFVLSADGATFYQGGVSDSKTFSRAGRKYLREALEDLASKRPVRTAQARTLGCAIARSH